MKPANAAAKARAKKLARQPPMPVPAVFEVAMAVSARRRIGGPILGPSLVRGRA